MYMLKILLLVIIVSLDAWADTNPSTQSQTTNSCPESKQKEFRDLYNSLQAALDYDGNKTVSNKSGKIIKISQNTSQSNSPGKQFEDMVTSEYQNALQKVAVLYQQSLPDPAPANTNVDLVNFLKVIDPSVSDDDQTQIKNDQTNDSFFKKLLDKSQNKFKDSNNPNFALNQNDIYLLQKLLYHAKDRSCQIENLNKNKKTIFEQNKLKEIRSSPLNILLQSIQNANITKDSKIDIGSRDDYLVDQNKAIKATVREAFDKIKKWYNDKENASCLAYIRGGQLDHKFMDSLQDNIQSCNYIHFIDSLLISNNASDIESILHFINSNQLLIDDNNQVASFKISRQTKAPLAQTKISPDLDGKLRAITIHITKLDEPKPVVVNPPVVVTPPAPVTLPIVVTPPITNPKKDCESDTNKKWNSEKNICEEKPLIVVDEQSPKNKCEADGKHVYDDSNQKCNDIPVDDKTKCEADGQHSYDDVAKKCNDKPVDDKTKCEADGKHAYDDVTKKCNDKPVDDKTKCEADGKHTYDDVAKKCNDKPVVAADNACKDKPNTQECCVKKNPELEDGATPGSNIQIIWDEKTKKCIDKKATGKPDLTEPDGNKPPEEEKPKATSMPTITPPINAPKWNEGALPGAF